MDRSANATIKGYFYQFEHSIVQLLSLDDLNHTINIEGREDIDITTEYEETLIQCKYYEGTEYNHSVIKDAVTNMLTHFKSDKITSAKKIKYKIYGHYKSGHKKLPPTIDIDFAKKNFLTYKNKKGEIIREIFKELSVSDSELYEFINILDIDISAKNYDEQSEQVKTLLKQKISNCDDNDLAHFYYPLAIDAIRKLAINKNESDRIITGKSFLESINKKEIIFNSWLIKFNGHEKYKKYLKKKYFTQRNTNIEKKARFFVIDGNNEYDVANFSSVLKTISEYYSHREHKTTPSSDRFCPYVCILGISEEERISLKKHLKHAGINFIDGYGFKGADFDIDRINLVPTKENLIKLKFLDSLAELNHSLSSVKNNYIEVFAFYRNSTINGISVPEGAIHNKIMIDSVISIEEIVK
ncbi:MAG: hypothetical protein JSR51_04725 [Proteobacteria bacterium]|nr:hypothetical protein [Pseudomonadota bacterium]